MIVRKKHILLTIVLVIFCSFIFYINYSWGNTIESSLFLSGMTFLLIFLSFALVWELRDFWQLRWYRVEHPEIEIEEHHIPLRKDTQSNSHQNYLVGDLLTQKHPANDSNLHKPLVIFTHGFSDDSILTRYLTIPIVYAGFDVFSYDNRGTARSSKAGKSSQFSEIVKDLGDVVSYFKTRDDYKNREISLVGTSLGATASIYHGLNDEKIKKVIAVAAIGNFQDILPKSPIPFRGKWWLWIRYRLKGVRTNPPHEINTILSPALQLADKKATFPNSKDWEKFIQKKLTFIHAKNDKIIPLSHFSKNLDKIDHNNNNFLITSRGGHVFMKYELLLVSKIIRELKM